MTEKSERSGPDSAGRTALNTVTAWLANLVTLGVGFFMTRFLLDQLGEQLYGVYSLGASVAAWSALVGGPIGTYAGRFGTEHLERGEKHELDRTFATSLGLSLLAMLVLPAPVIACAVWVQPLFHVPDELVGAARAGILIIGLGAVATVVIRVWEATMFVSRRIYLKNYAEIMARVLSATILVAWFVWLGPSVTVWMLVSVGLPLLLSLVFVIPLASKGLGLRLGAVSLDRIEARRALPFIGWITISTLGTVLFDNTDALLISALPELGVSYIAAYDVGTRWQRVVRPFVESFILALAPGLVGLAARGDQGRLRQDVIAHTRQLLLLGMVPTVAVACVARPFISHWVGPQFVERSVPVMWVALASALLWGPGPYSARVLIAVSRLRFSTIGGILAGVLNVALSVFFVRVLGLGLLGIALGTLAAVVVWCDVALSIEVCRAVGLRVTTYFREVWLRPLLAMALMLAFGAGLVRVWPPRSLLETLVQLAVSGTVMAGLAYRIGLTTEERSGVADWVAEKLGRRRGTAV